MSAAASAIAGVFQSEAAPQLAALRRYLPALAARASDAVALAGAGAAAASLEALAQLAEHALLARVARALRERVAAVERGEAALDAAGFAELEPVLGLCERALSGAPGERPEELAALAALEARVRAAPPPAPAPAPAPAALAPDARLLSLFREDLASCAAQLGAQLVQLEAGGDAQVPLERLMRAAHSLKGAARALGIDPLVELAHELEECFVAAQRSQLRLEPGHVDALLASSDLLNALAQIEPGDLEAAFEACAAELHRHALGARALRAGAPPPIQLSVLPAVSQLTALPAVSQLSVLPAVSEQPEGLPRVAGELHGKAPDNDAPDERVVRVAARSIERLVGLSAEALVQARRTDAFSTAIAQLKLRQAALLDGIELRGGAHDAELREQIEECRRITGELAPALDHYVRAIEDLSGRLYHEALQSRMRPFSDAVQSLPRLARDAARRLEKRVTLAIAGERTRVDRDVLEALQAPLQHLVRNAIDHGLEPPDERVALGKDAVGALRIEARHHAGTLAISVSDDGRGVDLAKLRKKLVETQRVSAEHAPRLSEAELLSFLFLPGLSTAARVTDLSGRGVGLDVVKSAVEACGGSVRISTQSGRGTVFHLQLPVTRSVIRAVIIEVGGEPYALPLLRVERIIKVPLSEVRSIEQRQCIELNGAFVGLVRAHELLETSPGAAADELVVLVIADEGSSGSGSDPEHARERPRAAVRAWGGAPAGLARWGGAARAAPETRRSFGLVVDRFIGEQDLVVRPLDRRLGKVPNLAAASLLNDGTPVLILDADDLLRSIEQLLARGRPQRIETRPSLPSARGRVLVVDDSVIVRELHKQMLMGQGYEVSVAVDGMDGWLALQNGSFQLVVSDIDMPRLNGFELVKRIKQDARTRATPVIIVSYKDREEDRLRGLEAGADYYLTKSSFHDRALLDAVQDLLGEP